MNGFPGLKPDDIETGALYWYVLDDLRGVGLFEVVAVRESKEPYVFIGDEMSAEADELDTNEKIESIISESGSTIPLPSESSLWFELNTNFRSTITVHIDDGTGVFENLFEYDDKCNAELLQTFLIMKKMKWHNGIDYFEFKRRADKLQKDHPDLVLKIV